MSKLKLMTIIGTRPEIIRLAAVIKKADSAVAAGSADADKAVVAAVSTIDKACAKGVLHKNTAARKVSKMMKAANAAK